MKYIRATLNCFSTQSIVQINQISKPAACLDGETGVANYNS